MASIDGHDIRCGWPSTDELCMIGQLTCSQFRITLSVAMAIDYFGCWAIEVLMRKIFADKPVRELITRGDERRNRRRQLEASQASEEKKHA